LPGSNTYELLSPGSSPNELIKITLLGDALRSRQ
jgi:hypothetical protein